MWTMASHINFYLHTQTDTQTHTHSHTHMHTHPHTDTQTHTVNESLSEYKNIVFIFAKLNFLCLIPLLILDTIFFRRCSSHSASLV